MTDEFDSAIEQYVNAAPNLAAGAMDENPDDGARAMKLARASGAPTEVVHNDLDNFDHQYREQLTREIVRRNNPLAKYLRDNPMARVVSNDDYGNLDQFTKTVPTDDDLQESLGPMGKFTQRLFDAVDRYAEAGDNALAKADKAVFGRSGGDVIMAGLDEWMRATTEAMESQPFATVENGVVKHGPPTTEQLKQYQEAGSLSRFGFAAIDATQTLFNTMVTATLFGPARGAAASAAKIFGLDDSGSERLQRDFQAAAEAIPMEPGIHSRILANEAIAGHAEAGAQAGAQVWADMESSGAGAHIRAGMMPPPGTHPAFDKLYADIDAKYRDQMWEGMRKLQAAATTERSVDLARAFAEAHYGDKTVSLDAVKALELYGDKPPAPDDGILGWVPGIEDKMAAARDYGQRVHIPIRDLMVYMDPKLATDLAPFIRYHPWGISEADKEAMAADIPQPPIESPMAQARAAMGAEPVFGVGDKKLTLVQGSSRPGFEDFGEFQMMDAAGQPQGYMTIKPQVGPDGKPELYVNDMGGLAGLHANSFGPSLIKDLAKQLAQAYPESVSSDGYLTVTGIRAEGARVQGDEIRGIVEPRVRLKVAGPMEPEVLDAVHSFLSDRYSKFTYAQSAGRPELSTRFDNIRKPEAGEPATEWFPKVEQIIKDLTRDLGLPYTPELWIGDTNKVAGTAVSTGHIVIKSNLNADKAASTAIHEFGHITEYTLLRNAGVETQNAIYEAFLRDKGSDKTIEQAAPITSIQDPEVYKQQRDTYFSKLFPEWFAEQVSRWITTNKAPTNIVEKFFAGIADVWRKVYEKVVGHIPLAAEVDTFMRGHWRGEGESQHPLRQQMGEEGGKGAQPPMQPPTEPPGLPPEISGPGPDQLSALRAESVGVDLQTWRRMSKAIREQHQGDIAAELKRAEEEQRRIQTAEWKANAKKLEGETHRDILYRQDVMADMFVGSGELFGKNMGQQRFSLREADLSPEQKAGLPRMYVSKSGLPVEAIANQLGFISGDHFVNTLIKYNEANLDRKLSSRQMMEKHVQDEIGRRMEAQHGKLSENIMRDAYDQAMSRTNLNVLHEEYMGAALKAGVTPIDHDSLVADSAARFTQKGINEVSSMELQRAMMRNYRNAIAALAKGDWVTAAKELQDRVVNHMMMADSAKLEKQLGGISLKEPKKVKEPKDEAKETEEEQEPKERAIRSDSMKKIETKFGKKLYDPKKDQRLAGDFAVAVRQMLALAGLKSGFASADGMAAAMRGHGFADLRGFVEGYEKANAVSGVELAVPDFILDGPKNLREMSVGEFRAYKAGIDQLIHLGQKEKKTTLAGEKMDRKDLAELMAEQIKERFDPRKTSINRDKNSGIELAKHFLAANTHNATLMARFDGRDPHGLFTTKFTYETQRASNEEFKLNEEYAKAYEKLGPIRDANKIIANHPFINPRTQTKIEGFTHKNLAAVISNMGNNYNWRTFCEGWDVDPKTTWKWVESVSTPEDFKRAQGLAEIFGKAKAKDDMGMRRLYGNAPENIQVRPVTIHGTTLPGWYHPVIGDWELSQYRNKGPSAELGKAPNNYWPTVTDPWVKRRTGASQVLSLNYDEVPMRLSQMLHAAAYREVVYDLAKLMNEGSLKNAIAGHYGPEYLDQMKHWLESLAGSTSYNQQFVNKLDAWTRFFTNNAVTSLIAFNARTVLKHGSTAFMMSAKEYSPNLAKSVPVMLGKSFAIPMESLYHTTMDLFGRSAALGESTNQFIMRNSEVIQARERNYLRSVREMHDFLMGEKSTIKDKIAVWGSWAVAQSDKFSAKPLWMAVYQREMAEHGVHGAAVDVANQAVIRAHGSSDAPNIPGIARTGMISDRPMFAMNTFLGSNLQRRIEMFHDLSDAYNLGWKERDFKTMTSKIGDAMSTFVANWLWVGMIEEVVSSISTEDHRSLGMRVLGTLTRQAFLGMAWVQQLAHGLIEGGGQESLAGALGAAIHDTSSLIHDVAGGKLDKHHAGKLVQDGMNTFGMMTGTSPHEFGNIARYGIDLGTGTQRKPQTWGEGARGIITGHEQKAIIR